MEEKKTALSVVIPVYNAESTIRKGLDSLLGQSLKEIEVICVDDGSTDESVRVIEEYAQKDPRVRLLRQQNKFAGIARNNGMDAAKGEYLFFLDADDYVMDYALEAALDKCRKHQLDCLRFRAYTMDERTGRFFRNGRNEFLRLMPEDYYRLVKVEEDSPLLKISVTPWGGMYRRTYLTEHGCRFNGLRCVNDRSFFNQVITAGGRIMCSQDRVTVHRINQSGSLVGKKAQHFDCQIESLRITEKEMLEAKVDPKAMELVMRQEYQDLLVWYGKYMRDPGRREEMDEKIRVYLEGEGTGYGWLLRQMREEIRPEEIAGMEAEEVFPLHEAVEKPRVTVIVPVKNDENTLNRTLEYLTNQTLEEMEFILADGGSRDGSRTIQREYAEADRRFRIIEAGDQDPVRAGVKEAKGEYICILEKDEYAEPKMYERLLRKAEKHRDNRVGRGIVRRAYLEEHPKGCRALREYKQTTGYRLKRKLTWLPRKAVSGVKVIRGFGLMGLKDYALRKAKRMRPSETKL